MSPNTQIVVVRLNMIRKIADQQKISYLIAGVLLFLLISMIGFAIAIVYSMTRLQSDIQNSYTLPTVVNNAGLNAYINMSYLHNRTMQIILRKNSIIEPNTEQDLLNYDKNLRKNFEIIKSQFPGDAEDIQEVEHLLDEWENLRIKMLDLARNGHHTKLLNFATSRGVLVYHKLEIAMRQIVASSQHYVEDLVILANIQSTKLIKLVWWLSGGFTLTCFLSAIVVTRKVAEILEHSKESARLLHENEERLKLALSGAHVGTWDLDPVTGNLKFDEQWGDILKYRSVGEMPHTFKDWSTLIHPDDQERVLQAMQDHVEDKISEYKVEYRIQANTGNFRWLVGHGKAVLRDQFGKALRVVGITRDITIQKDAENTIWKLAHTDSLTGLPNRSLFYDRLGQSIAQAKRQNKKFALLFLDLDDFKLVNDQFGHDAGDILLQEAAVRLRECIRNENTVARTGGDEFICILTNIENTENAAIVAKKIIRSLAEPFVINGHICQIGCSIGISMFPDNSETVESLVT